MILIVSLEQIQYAIALSEAVYKKRRSQGTVQKFSQGKAMDAAANYSGFLAETVMADWLKKPRPTLLEEKDVYDFLVDGKFWDVKLSERFLVNEHQWLKKKGVIDFFVFCRWVPKPSGVFSDIEVAGWLDYDEVGRMPKRVFDNGSTVFICRKLKPIKELVE